MCFLDHLVEYVSTINEEERKKKKREEKFRKKVTLVTIGLHTSVDDAQQE